MHRRSTERSPRSATRSRPARRGQDPLALASLPRSAGRAARRRPTLDGIADRARGRRARRAVGPQGARDPAADRRRQGHGGTRAARRVRGLDWPVRRRRHDRPRRLSQGCTPPGSITPSRSRSPPPRANRARRRGGSRGRRPRRSSRRSCESCSGVARRQRARTGQGSLRHAAPAPDSSSSSRGPNAIWSVASRVSDAATTT